MQLRTSKLKDCLFQLMSESNWVEGEDKDWTLVLAVMKAHLHYKSCRSLPELQT